MAEHPRTRGNPGGTRKRTAKPVGVMIDEFLAKEITVVENGKAERCSAFEIIFLQLCNQAIAGNARALNVLTKYSDFAASRNPTCGMRVEVIDDESNPKEPAGKND
jgi:hypothetical protein